MKKLLFAILIFWTIPVQADQLEVILEIEYYLDNEKHVGYFEDDMWLFEYAESNRFEQIFKATYMKRQMDTLNIYHDLIDRSILANKSSFPIKKFLLDPNSHEKIVIKQMSKIRYIKKYQQSGYTNIVLTELSLTDTSWIGNDLQTINYGYDDIGCRVYAHITQHSAEQTPLLKLLYKLSPKDGSFPTEEELIEMKAIVRKLKKHKAVVTMACGC